jgi:hypothetical protein
LLSSANRYIAVVKFEFARHPKSKNHESDPALNQIPLPLLTYGELGRWFTVLDLDNQIFLMKISASFEETPAALSILAHSGKNVSVIRQKE